MPKKHQNGPRSAQKRPPKNLKTTKKAIPNDKTTREPNQDDFKTVLEPQKALHTPVWCHPWGTIWEAKSAPKRNQKRCKNEAKIQESKKPIQDDLGPVLGRSWAALGAILGPWKRSRRYACRCFVKIHFFEDESIQRRSWDQLWPTKAPT